MVPGASENIRINLSFSVTTSEREGPKDKYEEVGLLAPRVEVFGKLYQIIALNMTQRK